MTEEIIIDGKDVSEWDLKGVLIPVAECKYFEGIGGCKETRGLCVANDNCNYKQHKRLEQENNSLQAQLNNITVQSNNAITALEQENEELRREIAELRKDCNHCNFHTYRSALKEIREYVTKWQGLCFDEQTADELMKICEVSNDRRNNDRKIKGRLI